MEIERVSGEIEAASGEIATACGGIETVSGGIETARGRIETARRGEPKRQVRPMTMAAGQYEPMRAATSVITNERLIVPVRPHLHGGSCIYLRRSFVCFLFALVFQVPIFLILCSLFFPFLPPRPVIVELRTRVHTYGLIPCI